MRIEATLPEARGQALVELARDLGLSRSQIVDEAVALFLKAILEARRGRRLVCLGSESAGPVCEIATPTLAQMEWAAHRKELTLSEEALDSMARLVESPPEPTPALRNAMRDSGE